MKRWFRTAVVGLAALTGLALNTFTQATAETMVSGAQSANVTAGVWVHASARYAGKVVGTANPGDSIVGFCSVWGDPVGGNAKWWLIIDQTGGFAGFIGDHDIKIGNGSSCLDVGTRLSTTPPGQAIWQHSKPSVSGETYVGSVGGNYDLRTYAAARGDEYPAGTGRTLWYLVFAPDVLSGVAGFISCSNTSLSC
ncbi:hypothetical protein [Amycolatopsis speibonae]|uniref:SH3 domain-containing protein n=1 Tax=Amycolatopsis speibonae TaxID=1450224 RepID=A0ABV7NPY6_9PSEU